MGKLHLLNDDNKSLKVKRPYYIDSNKVAHKGKKAYFIDENHVARKVFSGGEVTLKGYYPNFLPTSEVGWQAAGSANDNYALFGGGRSNQIQTVVAIDDNMTITNPDNLYLNCCQFDGFQIGKYAFFGNGCMSNYSRTYYADAYDENLVHTSIATALNTGNGQCDIFNGVLVVLGGNSFYTVDENLTLNIYLDKLKVGSNVLYLRAFCSNADYGIVSGGLVGSNGYKYVHAMDKNWTVTTLAQLDTAFHTSGDRVYASHPNCATAMNYIWNTSLVRTSNNNFTAHNDTRQTLEDTIVTMGGNGVWKGGRIWLLDALTYTYKLAEFKIGGMTDDNYIQYLASCKRKGKLYATKGYIDSATNYYRGLNVFEV